MARYDIIIIGGACAGLTAGIYSARRALKTLILTKDIGGQAAITEEIENYPGFIGAVSGAELMAKFKSQAEKYGAEIKLETATRVEKKGNGFVVYGASGQYESLAVILAFGLSHRKLGVPGENELAGRGVTYCAICDGPLYKNKIVGVVGAGNSAFDSAEYLADLCEKVYLFARRDKFRAEQILIDAVKRKKNVEIMVNTEVEEIIGKNKLEAVILQRHNGARQKIALNGLFVEAGYEPKTDFIKNFVELDEQGLVKVDLEARTSAVGVFAAGDVTNTPFKQVVISSGEGAKAALSAARYIQNIKGADDVPDWARRKNRK